MKTQLSPRLVKFSTLFLASAWSVGVSAQQTPTMQPADASALSPPVNHESGTIDEVLTAEDNGYRMRGYIVNWRGSRVFVSGDPTEPRQSGASLDFTVYRATVHGQRSLRFATAQTDDDATVAQDEGRNAQVSITAGTAKVEDVLTTDSGGYRFVAYLVSWHDKRVAVVDPLLHAPHAVGDQIDFRVFHTGAADNKQLSFALGD